MSWPISSRPEAENDIAEAAAWYEERGSELADAFIREVRATYQAFSENPFLNSRKHPTKPIRWRRTHRFPYRVIYEVTEAEARIVVIAVLHTAQQNRAWQRRAK